MSCAGGSRRKSARRFFVIAIAGLVLAGCANGKSAQWQPIRYPVSVDWDDTRWCVPLRLKVVLAKVSQRFGPVKVHSSHRWLIENWRKGGKPKSYHLSCRAVDFSVAGDPARVKNYLMSRKEVGGYSYYRQGFFHIDTGPRRTW